MEQFNASFREAWFTDTGGVRVQGGDKLLYKTDIPASQCARDNIFPVWIVANIKKTEDDKVWLDKVEIVNGFKNEEETEMVIDRAEEITNKFQKAIRLTRNEDWFVFPPGKEMDVTTYLSKYGYHPLTHDLVFHQQIIPIPNTPSRLPLFILNEEEINSEKLLDRLKDMLKATSFNEVLHKLAEQNIKNEDVKTEKKDNKQNPIPCADKLENPEHGGGRIQKGYKILYEKTRSSQYGLWPILKMLTVSKYGWTTWKF